MALHDGDLRSVRPTFELEGKNYIITGGGRGIGFAITRAIAEYGGNVAVLDILKEPVQDFHNLERDFGVKVHYIHADVTIETSLKSGFDQAIKELGFLDGCVTAAGIAIDKRFVDHQWDEFSRLQDINVRGTFFTAQLAAKQILRQGTNGSIVLIASITAHCTAPGHNLSAYGLSKAAVKMLSTSLSVELAPQGIRCNSISPGYIDTDMTQSLRIRFPHLVELMHSAPPMKRIGNRNDLTGAVIYLLSDSSAYTTGTDILITGGLHAGRSEPQVAQSNQE